VFRGLETRCAACGALRVPLTAPSVGLAGQPSRVGGFAALLLGAFVLFVGLSFALGLGLLLHSIWPGALVGWAVALPFSTATLFFGFLLIWGGRKLRRQGTAKQLAVRRDAMRALLSHRGGAVTPEQAASALAISAAEADATLTELAREAATEVRLDVDGTGQLRYDFSGDAAHYRVPEEPADEGVDAGDVARSRARS
jgi:hypothetical protein